MIDWLIKKMVKIGPVVFELNRGIESENCAATRPAVS